MRISSNVNDLFLSGISCPNRYIVDETQMERPAATTAKRVACLYFVWCVLPWLAYATWPRLLKGANKWKAGCAVVWKINNRNFGRAAKECETTVVHEAILYSQRLYTTLETRVTSSPRPSSKQVSIDCCARVLGSGGWFRLPIVRARGIKVWCSFGGRADTAGGCARCIGISSRRWMRLRLTHTFPDVEIFAPRFPGPSFLPSECLLNYSILFHS